MAVAEGLPGRWILPLRSGEYQQPRTAGRLPTAKRNQGAHHHTATPPLSISNHYQTAT